MKRLIIAASTMALGAIPMSLSAQEVEYVQIENKNLESGKVTLSPEKAYIYITGPNRTNGIFLKTPDDTDIAEYELEWSEELAKAQDKYPGRLRRYERQYEVWRKRPGGREPEKPIEPTAETFSIGDIERRMIVSFGPQFVFDKGEDENGDKTFSYLIEVKPGTYSYYGPIFYAPGIVPVGTCYCMGSVKFDAPAGQVTSLGDFLAFEWVTTEMAKQSDVNATVERSPAEAAAVDYSVPAVLEEFGAAPADLRAAGKMNNLFGILIGRLPPVEGVLDYDRDVPIDVKGLQEQQAAEAEAAAAAQASEPADEASTETGTEAVEMSDETVSDTVEPEPVE